MFIVIVVVVAVVVVDTYGMVDTAHSQRNTKDIVMQEVGLVSTVGKSFSMMVDPKYG